MKEKLQTMAWYFLIGLLPTLLIIGLVALAAYLGGSYISLIILASLAVIVPFTIGLSISIILSIDNPYEDKDKV